MERDDAVSMPSSSKILTSLKKLSSDSAVVVAARGGAKKNKCFLTAELIRVGGKGGWKRKNRGEQRRERTRWENSTLYSNI